MIELTTDLNGESSPLRNYDLIYLATPYTKYSLGIDEATKEASRIAGRLILDGFNIFSPIAHTHTIAMNSGMDPLDHSFWLKFDESMMKKSDALLVCQMPGWNESYGVDYEIKHFTAAQKPVYTFAPRVYFS